MGAGNNQQNAAEAAAAAAAAEAAVMSTAFVAAWRQQRQWLWRMTDGRGGGIGCGIRGSFCSSGGGGKHQDDGGMEEEVTWRFFMFV